MIIFFEVTILCLGILIFIFSTTLTKETKKLSMQIANAVLANETKLKQDLYCNAINSNNDPHPLKKVDRNGILL